MYISKNNSYIQSRNFNKSAQIKQNFNSNNKINNMQIKTQNTNIHFCGIPKRIHTIWLGEEIPYKNVINFFKNASMESNKNHKLVLITDDVAKTTAAIREHLHEYLCRHRSTATAELFEKISEFKRKLGIINKDALPEERSPQKRGGIYSVKEFFKDFTHEEIELKPEI